MSLFPIAFLWLPWSLSRQPVPPDLEYDSVAPGDTKLHIGGFRRVQQRKQAGVCGAHRRLHFPSEGPAPPLPCLFSLTSAFGEAAICSGSHTCAPGRHCSAEKPSFTSKIHSNLTASHLPRLPGSCCCPLQHAVTVTAVAS